MHNELHIYEATKERASRMVKKIFITNESLLRFLHKKRYNKYSINNRTYITLILFFVRTIFETN
jgi:hypothetical protein